LVLEIGYLPSQNKQKGNRYRPKSNRSYCPVSCPYTYLEFVAKRRRRSIRQSDFSRVPIRELIYIGRWRCNKQKRMLLKIGIQVLNVRTPYE
jgi:hypothetical protein